MRMDDHETTELMEALNSPPSCDMTDECSLPAQLGNLLLDRTEYVEALRAVEKVLREEFCSHCDSSVCSAWGGNNIVACELGPAITLIRKVLEAT